MFNIPAGSQVNDVDGGPPGPHGAPFPIAAYYQHNSIPACDTYSGCKTGTAAAANLDTRTVFNIPAGSQVNDVDGGPPGPHGAPYPIAIYSQHSSIPACNTYGGCKTGSAADKFDVPNTKTVFNLPAGSVVNDVDGGPPGPHGAPFPIAANV